LQRSFSLILEHTLMVVVEMMMMTTTTMMMMMMMCVVNRCCRVRRQMRPNSTDDRPAAVAGQNRMVLAVIPDPCRISVIIHRIRLYANVIFQLLFISSLFSPLFSSSLLSSLLLFILPFILSFSLPLSFFVCIWFFFLSRFLTFLQ